MLWLCLPRFPDEVETGLPLHYVIEGGGGRYVILQYDSFTVCCHQLFFSEHTLRPIGIKK